MCEREIQILSATPKKVSGCEKILVEKYQDTLQITIIFLWQDQMIQTFQASVNFLTLAFLRARAQQLLLFQAEIHFKRDVTLIYPTAYFILTLH